MNKFYRPVSLLFYLVAGLLLAAVSYFYLYPVLVNTGFKSFDDAYMFVRYIKHIEAGYGMVWNIGSDIVYGLTSTLYLIYLLLISLIPGLSDEQLLAAGSNLPALCALLIAPILCMKMARLLPEQFGKAAEFSVWLSLSIIYFMFATSLSTHRMNGMETCLALMLLLTFYILLINTLSKPQAASIFWLAFIAYLSFSTRPESLIIVALTPFLLFIFLQKNIRHASLYTVFLSALILLDTLLKYLLFEDILPLSYYAKQSNYLEGYLGYFLWHPFQHIFYFLLTITPFLPFIIYGVFSRNRRAVLCILLPIILTFIYLFRMMLIMNVEGRYFLPFTASIIFTALYSFNDFKHARLKIKVSCLLVTLVIFISCYFLHTNRSHLIVKYAEKPNSCVANTKFSAKTNYTPVTGLKNFLLVNSLVTAVSHTTDKQALSFFTSEYGYIGAKHPDITIYDAVGLHEKDVAYSGFDAEKMLEKKPDLIWLPHRHYTCINSAIINSEKFWQEYDFFPKVFKFGFAIRKDSPFYDSTYSTLEEIWGPYNLNRDLDDGIARLKNQSSKQ